MSAAFHQVLEGQCLYAHNQYRAQHGCPPLVLNRLLTVVAHAWAEKLTEYNIPRHTTDPYMGENIYVTSVIDLTGDEPVNSWYDELHNYDFQTTRGFLKAGHFTQVIWKGTQRMGVGFAKRGRTTIVVANYHPPGNVLGEYKLNVPPKLIYYNNDYYDPPGYYPPPENVLRMYSENMLPYVNYNEHNDNVKTKQRPEVEGFGKSEKADIKSKGEDTGKIKGTVNPKKAMNPEENKIPEETKIPEKTNKTALPGGVDTDKFEKPDSPSISKNESNKSKMKTPSRTAEPKPKKNKFPRSMNCMF